MQSIKPIGQRVLVKRAEAVAQTESGIYLPDASQEKSQEATVVGLGVGRDEDGKPVEFAVSVGDVVLLPKYGGTEVKVNGETMLIVNELDILAIVSR